MYRAYRHLAPCPFQLSADHLGGPLGVAGAAFEDHHRLHCVKWHCVKWHCVKRIPRPLVPAGPPGLVARWGHGQVRVLRDRCRRPWGRATPLAAWNQRRVAAADGGVRGQDEGDLRRPTGGRFECSHRGGPQLWRLRPGGVGLRDPASAGGHGRPRSPDHRHGSRGHRCDRHVPARLRRGVGAGRSRLCRRAVPAAQRCSGIVRGPRSHPVEAGCQAAHDPPRAGRGRAGAVPDPVPPTCSWAW